MEARPGPIGRGRHGWSLPREEVSIASRRPDLQISVTIRIADGRASEHPLTCVLGPAQRLSPLVVKGMENVTRRPIDGFGQAITIQIQDRWIQEELEVLHDLGEAF
tara:strand:+ start:907 stop:1224 length:318 start_codon:yes stop_codon:yes gene_type:complete